MASIKIVTNTSVFRARMTKLFFCEKIAAPVLNAGLKQAFDETQARVPVQTGSLKGSGKRKSRTAHGLWEGSITYGGSSPGPNSPVTYAGEQEKKTDFMGVPSIEHFEQYFNAAMAAISGV